jgi:hypothetical protein
MNRALMGAGLVDRLQVTVFPVIQQRALDCHIRELVNRPIPH